MKLLWFIPTHGDGRYLGTSYGGRPLDFGYLKQIACAVDNLIKCFERILASLHLSQIFGDL